MKLATKFVTVSSLVLTALSLGMGSVAVYANYSADLDRIDGQLNLLEQFTRLSDDPVGAAVLRLDTVGSNTQVAFYSINRDLTSLNDPILISGQAASLSTFRMAAENALTRTNANGDQLRMRSVRLPDSEYLVFATSLKKVQADFQVRFALVGLTAVLAVGLGSAFMWLFTRRDFRRITELTHLAEEISGGNFSREIAALGGRAELDVLNDSLARMLTALKGALTEAQSNQALMKEFLADVSHELKTPLALVRGYSELVFSAQGKNEDVAQRSRARLEDQILRMESLVNDLLLLAELESAVTEVMEPVSLTSLVSAAVTDLTALHPNRPVTSNIEAGITIEGQKHLLEQLLANLVSNISKYVQADAPVVVTLRKIGEVVELKFDDGGRGLPPHLYEAAIDEFQRFHRGAAENSKGTGLGLAIMAGVVSRHSGKFTLSPGELGGLSTRIVLPINQRVS